MKKINKNRLKKFCYKSIDILIIAFFSWILINTFFMETSTIYKTNQFIALPIALIMIILTILIIKFLNKKNISIKIEIPIILLIFGIIIFIEYFIFKNFRTNPAWDYAVVFYNAKSFVFHGTREYANYYYNYFSWYPNNIMLYYLFIFIIKIGTNIGLTSYLSCVLVNNICINYSIFVLYLLIRKKLGVKYGLLGLLIALSFLPLYLYNFIFYSDTFSLPFVITAIYLLDIKREKFDIKSILISLFLGCILFIGKEIKMTVIFALCAFLIIDFFRIKFSYYIKKYVLIFIPIILLTVWYNVHIVNNPFFDFKADNTWGAIPHTHWIMMGIEDPDKDYTGHNSYGGYSGEEYDFTKSFKNSEEAKKENIKVIKKRIKKYGVYGYGKYLTHKAVNAWGDGLYFSVVKFIFEPVNPNTKYRKYVDFNSNDFKYLQYFSQGVQLSFLILLIISSILSFKKNDSSNLIYGIKMMILAIMAFLLLWENRSRYLYNYIPLFIYVMVDCYSKILDIINNKTMNKKKNIV